LMFPIALIISLGACKQSSKEETQVDGREEIAAPALRGEDFEKLRDSKNWTVNGIPAKIDIDEVIEYLSQLSSEDLDFDGPNGGYLRSLCFWCPLDRFPEVLDILSRSTGNPSTLDLFRQSLCNRIVRDNPGSGLREAIEIIESKLGNGSLARDYRRHLFESEGFTPDAIEIFQSVRDVNERGALLAAMSSSIRFADDISALKSLDVAALTAKERDVIVSALVLRAQNAKLDPNGKPVKDSMAESIDVFRGTKEVTSLLSRFASDSPKEVLDMLSSFETSLTAREFGDVRLACVVSLDGREAMKLARGFAGSGAGSEVFSAGLESYFRTNPVAAERWIAESRASFSPFELEVVSTVAAKNLVAKNDLSRARQELEKISDPKIHARVEGWIWAKERDQLRKEVTGKPSDTVQGIVDGTSNFESYWLEEAVHTWVSKDFDAANAWYEKNWDSLPKEKAQYVAAGFATQAIGQGDVDTARQWAAMIQDAKTKARIEANIAKATSSER